LLNIEDNPSCRFEVIFLGNPGGEFRQFMSGGQKMLCSVLQKNQGPCGKLLTEGMLDETGRIDDETQRRT
jgi:hypothetical protein